MLVSFKFFSLRNYSWEQAPANPNLLWNGFLLGGRRAYMHVTPTHKMEVAFLLHSSRRSSSSLVVVCHWNSVLLVSRGQQGQLHIRLTERELNALEWYCYYKNFHLWSQKISGNLLTNYITITADVLNHVFKGNAVSDRDSTRRDNCAKQVIEGQC